MVPLVGLPRHPLRLCSLVPAPRLPRALLTPAEGPPPPLRRLGRCHRPDVRHRPVRRSGACQSRPQPRARRPRRRQSPGDLQHHQISPRRADQDRGVRPLARFHRPRPAGDEALRRLREAVAGLDVGVLVNNAGVAKPGAVYLREADVEACVRLMRVNLWAVTEVTAAVLPGMVERGRGAVVNMGSASSEAIPSFPLYTMYAATKRYVAQFSRSLYVEYRSEGIDVQFQVIYIARYMFDA
ncbi:unnamed protein product [Triticum turgidum subsp. durum]|uniref:Uncharacterized protein n=1 Tax=Triticum turgidum subsp. durum TaxID=4567 RepID=A0A9R0ZYZ5_TRITD|nr:unnamed protein product [Triticum turgidum subsp. durum]